MFLRIAGLITLLGLCYGASQAAVNSRLYGPYQELLGGFLLEQTLPGDGLVSAFDYPAALADGQTNSSTTTGR